MLGNDAVLTKKKADWERELMAEVCAVHHVMKELEPALAEYRDLYIGGTGRVPASWPGVPKSAVTCYQIHLTVRLLSELWEVLSGETTEGLFRCVRLSRESDDAAGGVKAVD